MNQAQAVVVEVTFQEYTQERLTGKWPAAVIKDQVLMSMFAKKGVRMDVHGSDSVPTPPVEIITDTANQKFVIKQIQ